MRPPAVGERRHPAHVLGGSHGTSRRVDDGVDERRQRLPRVVEVHQAGALQHQRAVVLREAFGQPQLARHVRAVEIERLDVARPDPLDVPAVEELVRDRVEQPRPIAANRGRRGHHRAVAVFHAVFVGVRQVVGEKRVVARLVRRELAVDRAFLADDSLDVLHEAIELLVGARVMRRKPERAAVDRELPRRDRSELRRAVDEVLKVRRGELERRRAGMQLRRDGPPRLATPGSGGDNVTVAGRSSSPRAHMIAAGMFMCAWVVSTARYVPSTRSPNTL